MNRVERFENTRKRSACTFEHGLVNRELFQGRHAFPQFGYSSTQTVITQKPLRMDTV